MSSMCGWGKGICAKCVDPPTCVCFVSSTDGQEVAGPSGQEVAGPSGQAAPPPGHQAAEEPQEGQESPGQGSGHNSPHEEVQGEEDEGGEFEDDRMDIAREVMLCWEQDPLAADSSQATIRGSPSPNRAAPPGESPAPRPQASSGGSQATIRGSPSHPSPNSAAPPGGSSPPRPEATSAGRKATQKTRGVAEFLPANLQREQARQTQHLGQVSRTLAQVQQRLDSINESLSEVSCNSLAYINCFSELQAATKGVALEVAGLTQAVRDNTAALTLGMTRIAMALEGRPAGGQPPGEAPAAPPLRGRGRPRRSSRRRR